MRDGRIEEEEFVESIKAFVKFAAEYNLSARRILRVRMVEIKKYYELTAPIYLDFENDVQVFYSPTYQVPVFYFTTDVNECGGFRTVKTSFAEHPITGLPCYYLHPCQTATILSELASTSTPLNYLLAWIGIYAKEIPNLEIAMELFAKPSQVT
jgi:hypothetical protein